MFRVFPAVVDACVTVAVPVFENVGTSVVSTEQASVEPATLYAKD